ncbi:MAG: hypothetical protein MJ202_04240 [Lentisphaeria bacterium]|nr:hypothetical protein [Lentisphaeria bacterium]
MKSPALIKVKCPTCHRKQTIDSTVTGQPIICNHCNEIIPVSPENIINSNEKFYFALYASLIISIISAFCFGVSLQKYYVWEANYENKQILINNLTKTEEELTAKKQILELDLQKLEEEVSKRKDYLLTTTEAKQQTDALLEQEKTLTKKIEELQKNNSALEVSYASQSASLEGLKAQIIQSTDSLNSILKQLEASQKQLQETNASLAVAAETNDKLQTIKAEIDQRQKEYRKLQDDLQEVLQRKGDALGTISGLVSQVSMYQKDLDDKVFANSKMEKQVEILQQQITTLEGQKKELSTVTVNLTSFQTELEKLKQEVATVQETLQKKKTDTDILVAKEQELTSSVQELETTLAALKQSYAESKSSNDLNLAILQNQQQKIMENNSTISSLQEQSENLQKKVMDLLLQEEKTKGELALLENQKQNLQIRINTMNSENANQVSGKAQKNVQEEK